ncbi:ATP-binding protein [Dechloromonas sp. XY25]|uniref:histidine kinase n=1 Tax=Dechloromonas hankyongensis TaxID=2908002 RepID=A0ABS9K5H1_9RHOO|nr:ATP-binding protein [Dechloromonas hankyongensis]MCG2578417.1 ATP-binding protein [Dechloromonas hankyongensis]
MTESPRQVPSASSRPAAFATDDVDLEKTRLLFRNTGLAQAVVAINACLLLYLIGGLHPPTWAIVWWGLAVSVAAARYGLARRFFAVSPEAGAVALWQRRAIAATFGAALLWSAGGVAMMLVEPGYTRLLVALVLAGMVSGAVPLLSAVPRAFRSYAVPVMGAIILTASFDFHGAGDWILAAVSTLYLIAALQSSRFFHERLDSSLRLAAQMRQMAEELEHALHGTEAANQAKSQFLATMSHEIRTPMNGILGTAQLLMMPDLQESERQDYLRVIVNSGQTLMALLNDILDLSKIEAGRVELEALPFVPAHLLDEMAMLFGEEARSKDLQLDVHWAGDADACFTADPVRLRQMLSNLVGNAIKFTARGGVILAGKVLSSDADGVVLEFTVTDTGIGIPADKLPLLFQPFSQVDASTTRHYGGTGLGLSIVRNLVDLMGGEVGIDSCEGEGTRVRFTIRAGMVGSDVERRRTPRLAPVAAGGDVPAGRALRVLVVDDNATNRKVVGAMLSKLGFHSDMAHDGAEAVRRVTAGEAPDVLLMDCQMPIMDGFEATARIRRWEAEQGRSPLPIIALTAGAFAEDRERCVAAGMTDFLTKPVDLNLLGAMLHSLPEGR